MCKGKLRYKAEVGSIMYAMMATRANIAFAVSMVSQFISKAGPPHWMFMKHIMRLFEGMFELQIMH
jgi:hypothetical protein